MSINKLPENIINMLVAWDVISKPLDMLKELVENSLDAWAKNIEVNLEDWWKGLISVQDDGDGIQLSDMELLLNRHTTSKIKTNEDFGNISDYWFRWEALASIAEISKLMIMSKTAYSEIWTKIIKRGDEKIVNHVPVPFEHGTLVTVEDLFYNIPTNLKSLESSQTEFYYCYNYFVNIVILHYDKSFALKKNNKTNLNFKAEDSLIWRINAVYKRDWTDNLKPIEYQDDDIKITGFVWDSSIRFGSIENIKTYINNRPVQNNTVSKAIIDAYSTKLTSGEYPLAVLMVGIKPDLIDVNIDPSKSQVNFLDDEKIYQFVYDCVYNCLDLNEKTLETNTTIKEEWQNVFLWSKDLRHKENDNSIETINHKSQKNSIKQMSDYQIVWQLRNSYIIVQSGDNLYYLDQQMLAEEVVFEDIKKTANLVTESLLQATKFNVSDVSKLTNKISELNKLWFNCSLLPENIMLVQVVPKAFVTYAINLEKFFNYVLYLDEIKFDDVLDGIFNTKACKVSIKSGNKLSYDQMSNLIKDGLDNIEWMFEDQNEKWFLTKISKNDIDSLFNK